MMMTRFAETRFTPSEPACEGDQIALFNSSDLSRSSPEFGDLQGKPGVSETTICSHCQGWWVPRGVHDDHAVRRDEVHTQ